MTYSAHIHGLGSDSGSDITFKLTSNTEQSAASEAYSKAKNLGLEYFEVSIPTTEDLNDFCERMGV